MDFLLTAYLPLIVYVVIEWSLSSENTWDVLILQPTSFSAIPNCFRTTQWVQIRFNVALPEFLSSCSNKIPYARYYKLRLVYFLPFFENHFFVFKELFFRKFCAYVLTFLFIRGCLFIRQVKGTFFANRFPSLGNFVHKKVGNQKNKDHYVISTFKTDITGT